MNIFDLIYLSKQEINSDAIRQFLAASTTVSLMNFRLKAAAGGRSNWCWAVVAQGVSRYYDPGLNIVQCAIAKMVFPNKICCDTNTDCDDAALLSTALRDVGNYQGHSGRAIEFATIATEIGEGRPLGCRKSDANGHYVAISATLKNGPVEKVTVHDPIYEHDQVPYGKFVAGWTNTYFTKQ